MLNIGKLDFVKQINNMANVQKNETMCDFKEGAFSDSLFDVDPKSNGDTSTGEESSVPIRWTDVSLYTLDSSPKGYSVNRDALLKVKEQLKAEGIDTDSRTPTHDITEEQMEWLNSKYNLDFFSTCSITNEEFGNFILDLAYLNVYSFEEVENMYAGIIPPQADHPQAVSLYYHGDPEDGSGAGYIPLMGGDGNVVNEDMPTDHISNYLKAEHPRRTETEYQQMATEFAAKFQNRLKILEKIFDHFSYKMKSSTDGAFLNIEDISDKLKEDYGSLIWF